MGEQIYMARLTAMGEDVCRRQRKAKLDTIALVYGKPARRIKVL